MAPRRSEPAGVRRLLAAWRRLAAEQRAVLVAALALLASMLLPWYSRTVSAIVSNKLVQEGESKLAITVFSFVEAAIFLVAVGVSLLILARGDRRPFHLPGGDGTIVSIAGAWATFLIFYRFVDKPSGGSGNQVQVEYGLSWGIFFGLLAALALLASGLRLRAAQLTEPALAGTVSPSDGPVGAPVPEPRPRAPAPATAVDAEVTRVVATPDTAATSVLPPDGEATTVSDPDQAFRDERRRAREARRRGEPFAGPGAPAADEAPTDVRPAHDPDAFRPPEFELPPRRDE